MINQLWLLQQQKTRFRPGPVSTCQLSLACGRDLIVTLLLIVQLVIERVKDELKTNAPLARDFEKSIMEPPKPMVQPKRWNRAARCFLVACIGLSVLSIASAQPSTATEYVYVNGRLVALERLPSLVSIQSVIPSAVSLAPGGAAQTVMITIARANYAGTIALGIGTLPAGVSASLTAPLTGNGGTITLTAAPTAPAVVPQSVPFTLNGAGLNTVSGSVNVGVGAVCTYSLSTSSASASSAGGTGSFGVIAPAGCAWSAVSNATWLTITSGGSGSGNRMVNYSVAANSNPTQRSETLTVAGQTFTVTQDGTQLPMPGVPSPAVGSGSSQTFTFTFTDPNGYADLAVLDILINNFLDGRHGCYVAYVPSGPGSGSVFLVDDAGDAGGPYSAMVLPGSGTVQNSQCTVSGSGSSASSSGNTLTLTLAVTFAPGFAGNKVFYTAARSNTQNSGWLALGTWGVPGLAPAGPAVGGVFPGRSATASQTYTFTFTDTNGFGDLAVLDILINNFLDGRQACYVAYVPSGSSSGSVFLVDDAGDAGGPYSTMVLPGSGTVQNSQCKISGAGSSVSASGNTLTLNLAITISSGFAGNHVFYLAARNNGAGNSGWQAVGSVTVP